MELAVFIGREAGMTQDQRDDRVLCHARSVRLGRLVSRLAVALVPSVTHRVSGLSLPCPAVHRVTPWGLGAEVERRYRHVEAEGQASTA